MQNLQTDLPPSLRTCQKNFMVSLIPLLSHPLPATHSLCVPNTATSCSSSLSAPHFLSLSETPPLVSQPVSFSPSLTPHLSVSHNLTSLIFKLISLFFVSLSLCVPASTPLNLPVSLSLPPTPHSPSLSLSLACRRPWVCGEQGLDRYGGSEERIM